ncbi:MAG: short-chain fatty acyl-CoA regulator family protein [Pseudomonadota bacterium]
MPKSALTGSRIRERRIDLGLKQARLAEICGISASYLNLIEHNRRRIGGKLLNDLAHALGVEPASLSEGADLALLDALRSAADRSGTPGVETVRAEELAGRFPGWARLVATQDRRIATLERTIEALNDRLTHDPFLSASLHDVLSTVTAIHSASAILADDDDIDPEWQARFHRNIFEDSERLAEASRALVSYLDSDTDKEAGVTAPQEELEAWLDARGYHVAEMERALPPGIETLVGGAEELLSSSGRALAGLYLARYRRDAERMPLGDFQAAIQTLGPDPAMLAQNFAVDLPAVFRRLATLPTDNASPRIGLVICDTSGTLTFRKPIDGFPLPRFGAACPLLPLYQALSRPMSPVRAIVEQPGRTQRRFLTYAISQPAHPAGFDGPTVFEASMLMLPDEMVTMPDEKPIPIGTSCRICSRRSCAARREPSILSEEA